MVVTEKVQLRPNRARVIELKFQFLPHKNYKHNFGLKPEQVLEYFENKFIIKHQSADACAGGSYKGEESDCGDWG